MSVRIALFNDTSANGHFGCDAVMRTLAAAIAARGGEILYRHPVGEDWRGNAAAERAVAEADLVLVNGEGTIHHNTARAQNLAAVAPFARRLGKPAFLVNATIQAIGPATVEAIAHFDRCWVRDTRSAQALRQHGIEAEICGDLSLAHHLPAATRQDSRPIVIDSVRADVMVELATLSRHLDAELVSMKYRNGDLLVLPPDAAADVRASMAARRVDGVSDYAGFAAFAGHHAWMLTGRFHAVCMAINIGLPFLAFPSNTAKIEALIADAGLSPRRMLAMPPAGNLAPFDYSSGELAAIAGYIARTRQNINAMFDAILPDAARGG